MVTQARNRKTSTTVGDYVGTPCVVYVSFYAFAFAKKLFKTKSTNARQSAYIYPPERQDAVSTDYPPIFASTSMSWFPPGKTPIPSKSNNNIMYIRSSPCRAQKPSAADSLSNTPSHQPLDPWTDLLRADRIRGDLSLTNRGGDS